MNVSPFLRNNIEFREASSMALSIFYRTKACMLSELLSGQKFKFSATAKEVLLLYYSSWTDWLQFLEVEYIKCSDHTVGEKTVEAADRMMFLHINRIEQFLSHNPRVFDATFAKLWLEIVQTRRDEIRQLLLSSVTGDIAISFTDVVEKSNQFITHMLFNIHELDSWLRNTDVVPFINIDAVDVNLYRDTGKCFPTLRYSLYRQKHGRSTDRVAVKCNMPVHSLNRSPETALDFQSLLSDLEKNGAEIICIL